MCLGRIASLQVIEAGGFLSNQTMEVYVMALGDTDLEVLLSLLKTLQILKGTRSDPRVERFTIASIPQHRPAHRCA